MNIDDLIYYVTKCRDPQGKGPDLFHNTVFQENFLYRFKSSHRETEAAFYRCGYQEFSALTAPERDIGTALSFATPAFCCRITAEWK